MMKKRITGAVLALLATGLLLVPGCAQATYWGVSYNPQVVSDEAGGAIVVYNVMCNSSQRDFYAQRIGSDRQKLWGERGALVGNSSKRSSSGTYIQMISDGSSGAIITQRDFSSGQQTRMCKITRVDANGKVLWQHDSAAIGEMVADGNGGAFIVGIEGTVISVNRIDSEGHLSWGESGVSFDRPRLGTTQFRLASDGDGGIVIAWLDSDPQRAKASHPGTTEEVHAQRIDARGNLVWGQDGARLYVSPEDTAGSSLAVKDGNPGETLFTWEQFATVGIVGDSPVAFLNDICAQKSDSNGDSLWPPNGVALGISRATGAKSPPIGPLIVSDGSGGAVITWQDNRVVGRTALYAQRVSDNGTVTWTPGGVKIFDIDVIVAFRIQVVEDQEAGVITSLSFYDLSAKQHGIRVNRLDAEGNSAWLVEPVDISVDLVLGTYHTQSDGERGVLLTWSTRQTENSDSSAFYVQRIDRDGRFLWGEQGVRLDK